MSGADYQRKRRAGARERKLCGQCYTRKTVDGKYRCPSCEQWFSEYMRTYQQNARRRKAA